MSVKPKVLVFADWYLPGKKAGGPIRSVHGFVENLKSHLSLWLFTSDRDLGDTNHYEGILVNQWIEREGVQVLYSTPEKRKELLGNLMAENWNFIYLNSLFSMDFTLRPLMALRSKKSTQVVLAPRGMFGQNALKEKGLKKKVFLKLATWFGLYNNLVWHCTNENERNDVRAFFRNAETVVIPNLSAIKKPDAQSEILKKKGELKLVYLGRIASVKNLLFLLKVMREMDLTGLSLDVFGPLEDLDYWKLCQIQISAGNLPVVYKGEIEHEKVQKKLSEYHFMVSPTKGENFGHTIIESLSVGTPVIITDRTPWKSLDKKHVGFDLPLDKIEEWKNILKKTKNMGDKEYSKMRYEAKEFSKQSLDQVSVVEDYRNLFS